MPSHWLAPSSLRNLHRGILFFFTHVLKRDMSIDRLIHHSVILELQGPSYRMEKAKARKEAEKAEKP